MADRPINVPLDWVRRDCANPSCDKMVWVPDLSDAVDATGRPVLPICSTECAMVLAKSILG